MDAHGVFDFIRDIGSAVVSGLLLLFLNRYWAHRRATKERLDRHAVEIRHTQKETNVQPFYGDSESKL